MATWEQLTCPTCGSNAVEMVNGFLCCKACKSKHTLQEKISEEEVIALNNATTDRQRWAFDEAFEKYELLLQKYPDNEMANWGAFLSFYGIKYEKDVDGKCIPTCHRLSEKPVKSSPYYRYFNADHKAKAEEIEKLRLAIMDKAKKIQPYDVFICYKATEDRFGMPVPTKEASWARDVYDMLTHDLKLRVFFAEKSLQGSNIEYEPHIYSALNSAKLMLVLTTGIENVNATWVKNEWKRFSHYIKEGQDKTIRVVYDGIQPYDLPQELQKTQAIDHNVMGWDKAVMFVIGLWILVGHRDISIFAAIFWTVIGVGFIIFMSLGVMGILKENQDGEKELSERWGYMPNRAFKAFNFASAQIEKVEMEVTELNNTIEEKEARIRELKEGFYIFD